jgi:hypothetical protein
MTDSEKPTSSALPTDLGFALMLETACEDFENLRDVIAGGIKIEASESEDRAVSFRRRRASARTQMALAKSFVSHVARARRICEMGADSLGLDRLDRTRFLKATEKVVGVRDVNEHGFEPGARSKPSVHSQEGGNVDETSLVVHGPDQILMGPLTCAQFMMTLTACESLRAMRLPLEKSLHR